MFKHEVAQRFTQRHTKTFSTAPISVKYLAVTVKKIIIAGGPFMMEVSFN